MELIIIDHDSGDNTSEVVSKYVTRAFIRLINRGGNYSFASSCNLGAAKAANNPHVDMGQGILQCIGELHETLASSERSI